MQHKRTIALAAAALLFNGAAITQASPKQPRNHRAESTAKRAEDTAKGKAEKS